MVHQRGFTTAPWSCEQVSLLRKLIPDKEERGIFGALVVIAANCGGVWTPIGDVTTTMLWINNNLSTLPIVLNLFLPSVRCSGSRPPQSPLCLIYLLLPLKLTRRSRVLSTPTQTPKKKKTSQYIRTKNDP